ncbi:MAG: ABC transporter permease [Spirochaetia bacterium]|nr:ABC transporter permease [Spirochaetia bacterium]
MFSNSLKGKSSPVLSIARLKSVLNGPIVGLVAIVLLFTIATPNFLTFKNFINILNQISIWGILSIGMTFVIITGGIDLSVGCVLGLSSMVLGYLGNRVGLPMPIAIILALFVGTIAGSVNGLLVTKTKLPPFIATLSMFYIARGLANVITGGEQILGYPDWFMMLSYKKYLNLFTITSLVFLLLIAVGGFFLAKTRHGRNIYAVGGNMEVARLSGINVSKYTMLVYVISGTMSAIAGILIASRVNASEPYQGNTYEMYAIAIAVIGGASLSGGEGSMAGTLIGAFIIAILNNGLNLNGISPFIQTILIGVIIVFAVGLDMLSRRKHGAASAAGISG